jgi:hypothetical protein
MDGENRRALSQNIVGTMQVALERAGAGANGCKTESRESYIIDNIRTVYIKQ